MERRLAIPSAGLFSSLHLTRPPTFEQTIAEELLQPESVLNEA
jgi:hypothetical protein